MFADLYLVELGLGGPAVPNPPSSVRSTVSKQKIPTLTGEDFVVWWSYGGYQRGRLARRPEVGGIMCALVFIWWSYGGSNGGA